MKLFLQDKKLPPDERGPYLPGIVDGKKAWVLNPSKHLLWKSEYNPTPWVHGFGEYNDPTTNQAINATIVDLPVCDNCMDQTGPFNHDMWPEQRRIHDGLLDTRHTVTIHSDELTDEGDPIPSEKLTWEVQDGTWGRGIWCGVCGREDAFGSLVTIDQTTEVDLWQLFRGVADTYPTTHPESTTEGHLFFAAHWMHKCNPSYRPARELTKIPHRLVNRENGLRKFRAACLGAQTKKLAEDAASTALTQIQDALGVETGDLAGVHFSGKNWDNLITILSKYIDSEKNWAKEEEA